jgi:hypothetical protein
VGREIEHERVIDRLIDLQARLRGEPDPPAPPSAWDPTEAWAAGPAPRRRRVTRVDPVTVAHRNVQMTVTPSEVERARVEPAPARPGRFAPGGAPRRAEQEATGLVPHQERSASPERLASILGRVDDLRRELTRVVETLDAATEELAPDPCEPGHDERPRDRLQQPT